MFDAEIAATLLNRWDRKRAYPGDQSPLDLLEEGKLRFWHEGGDVHAHGNEADRLLRVECLTFTDGSRALRVTDADGQSGWTRWTAAEPVSKRQTNQRTDHADIPEAHPALALPPSPRSDGVMAHLLVSAVA